MLISLSTPQHPFFRLNQGRVRVVLASFVQGKSAGSAAIGPAAFATKIWEAIGVKSARKWLELFTTSTFMVSGCTPSILKSSRSSSCFLPLATATSTPSISSKAHGPSPIREPVIMGPLSVTLPSESALTLKVP